VTTRERVSARAGKIRRFALFAAVTTTVTTTRASSVVF
jgi:hypothetical protein